jgi:Membrane protein involved in the export of O-antigen and teichoic acid
LATRVTQFVIGFGTSFLMARLLGPDGRGVYYLVVLTPSMLFALGQFGLPSAVSFFAGRGRSGRSLQRLSLVLAGVLAAALLAATIPAVPFLTRSMLRAAPPDLLRLALISLPLQFVASFGGALLIGRQTMRRYNVILVLQSAGALLSVVVLVGVLGMGVTGAVIGNLIVAAAGALAITIEARRVTRNDPETRPVRLGELARYGAKLYPASLSSFFSYRADVFLLGLLLGDAGAIGLYSMAVSLAELTFFVPDSVSTVFFPRVAAAERASADEMTPLVSRFTVMVTALSVVGLVPAAFVLVRVILPAFTASLPAFLVILPGIVALSVAKVLSSYISGLGLPLPVAAASVSALIVNVIANLLLIPLWGIVGASAASLVSYTIHAAILVAMASRLTRRGWMDFLIPGPPEARRLRDGLVKVIGGLRPSADGADADG